MATRKPRGASTAPAEETTSDDAADAPPAAARPASRKPERPRFPMSEGTRDELARTGRATDPWTGEVLEDEEARAAYLAREKARGVTAPARQA